MKIKRYFWTFSAVILFFVAGCLNPPILAQDKENKETETIGVDVKASQLKVIAGQELKLIVKLKLAEGMHANSDTPKDINLIPTIFTPDKIENVTWGDVLYPKPTEVNEWYSTEPISVFEDGAEIVVPLKVETSAPIGKLKIGGKLRIQACDHEKCYPAKRIPAYLEVTVIEKSDMQN